jgi:hypothetical protein
MHESAFDVPWGIFEVERGIFEVEQGIFEMQWSTDDVNQARFEVRRAEENSSNDGKEVRCGAAPALRLLCSPRAR